MKFKTGNSREAAQTKQPSLTSFSLVEESNGYFPEPHIIKSLTFFLNFLIKLIHELLLITVTVVAMLFFCCLWFVNSFINMLLCARRVLSLLFL